MWRGKTLLAIAILASSTSYSQLSRAQSPTASEPTIAERRVVIERLARRLDAALPGPDDILGLPDLKELLNAAAIKTEQLEASLGSIDAFEKYLRKNSPVVSTRFCDVLGLDQGRCEEFDCLTDPEAKADRTADNPRLCPVMFSGASAMPTNPVTFAEWVSERIQKAGEANWQQARASWTSNGQFHFPVRQSAVVIRSLLSTHHHVLAENVAKLKETAAKKGGPFADLITEILMRAEADRRLVEAVASAVEEISADAPLAAELLGADAAQLRAHALLVLRNIERDPYALLRPTKELRPAAIALKNAVDGLRERLAKGQFELSVAAESALLRQASARKMAHTQECSPNPLMVPLVHDGATRLLLDIGNLAGREQGEGRLIFARELLDIRVSVKTTEGEKDVRNCKDAEFLARPLRLIDAGVVLPVRRVGQPGAYTFELVSQAANLDIGIDERILASALSDLGTLPPFLRFAKPRLVLPDKTLKNISVEFLVSVEGMGVSLTRTGRLLRDGRLDPAAFVAEISDLQVVRAATLEYLAGNRGMMSFSRSVQLANVTAAGDWTSVPRLRGTLAITGFPPAEADLVLAPDDAGNWSLRTSTELLALRNEILRRVLEQGPIVRGLRQIASLREGADAAARQVQQHVGVANVRLSSARRLAFDLHVDLPGSPISLTDLVLDPDDLTGTTADIANRFAASLAASHEAAVVGFVRRTTAALFIAVEEEFDRLVAKVNGTKLNIFDIEATLEVDSRAKMPRPVLIRVVAEGQTVTIKGLTLTGFAGDAASPLPRLQGALEISQSDRMRLQQAVAAKIKSLIGLDWLQEAAATISFRGTTVEANIQMTGVPLIGTFLFPVVAVDLRDGSTRFDTGAVKARLRNALAARLSPEITARVQEILPEQFRSIVRSVETTFQGDDFVASGNFAFSGVSGRIDIKLSVSGGKFSPSVALHYQPNLQSIIESAVGRLLGGGKVEIREKSFDRPHLKLDVKDVPIAGDTFQVSAFGVGFTPKGVEIDGLGLVIPMDIPIPPAIVISRPRVSVVFRGARSFSVGGDITINRTGEIFRIEGVLTGKIDELVIELDGKVVLLTMLPLFESKGRTELKTAIITTRSRTVGLLRALVPMETNSKLDAKAGLLTFDSDANLLGIRIKGGGVVDTGLRLQSGGTVEIGKAGTTVSGSLTAPFGTLKGGLASDPFMLKPKAQASGSLSIVGLKSGFDLKVDYGSATLQMGLLGITVTVIAPEAKSLTLDFLEGIVRNLLKPSFDLNALKRRDIVISLIPPGNDADRPKPPDTPQSSTSPSGPSTPAAPAPRTGGGPPPSPLPRETYMLQPARGNYTGWVTAYTSYPEAPEYFCKTRLKLGTSEKPKCIGPIISKSIAELLKDGRVRSLETEDGTFPFKNGRCRNGTKCGDAELDREAEIEVWAKGDYTLAGFAVSHKGVPHPVTGSQVLISMLGANPSTVLRERLAKSQPIEVLQKLIGYDAEPVVLGDSTLGLTVARPLLKGSTAWSVEHKTSNSDVRGGTLLHLVDVRENLIKTIQSGGFRAFMAAFTGTAPDEHPLRPLLLGELRSSDTMGLVWAGPASALIMEEDFVRLAQLKDLGPRISLDPKSRVERYSILSAPPFHETSLEGALTRFLVSDPSWQEARIDSETGAAVVGAGIGSSSWRLGLVLWNKGNEQGRHATMTSQQSQSRLGCWKAKGWLRPNLAERLSRAEEAGRIFRDAVMVSTREYVDMGFLVNPRLFLEECPS